MSRHTYLTLGCLLVTLALIGFITVADDFRHTGESFVVLGILFSGAALLAAGLLPRAVSVLALHWIPAGVARGSVIGVVADRAVIGVSGGTAVGLVLARLRRSRGSSASLPSPPA